MTVTRRTIVQALGLGLSLPLMPRLAAGQAGDMITKTIPKTGEPLPAIGLGTWITFNVGDDPLLKDECAAVIATFFEGGGRMIDSSPMYGSSQPTIGYGLRKLGHPDRLFSAEKVWISDPQAAPPRSRRRVTIGASADSISCRSTIWSPGRSICPLSST